MESSGLSVGGYDVALEVIIGSSSQNNSTLLRSTTRLLDYPPSL